MQNRLAKLVFVGLCVIILVLTSVTVCLDKCGYAIAHVAGTSMYPTLHDTQYVLMRLTREEELPKDNPIVWARLDDGRDVVKRVIGYPGDTVQLIDGATVVNGEQIMEAVFGSWDNWEITLSENQYILLGDNRCDSNDSRYWLPAYIGLENIIGFMPESGLG